MNVPKHPSATMWCIVALQDRSTSADHISRTPRALCDECVAEERPCQIPAYVDRDLIRPVLQPLHLAQLRHQMMIAVIGPPAVNSRTFNYCEAISGVERIESGYVLSLRRSENRLDDGSHLCRVCDVCSS